MLSIYTVHYNRLEFLKLQHEYLNKHCTDNFNYIVVNNGVDSYTKNEISNYCKLNTIKEIIIEQDDRIPYCSHDHIMALDYVYTNYISRDDSNLRVVMDCDVIPYKNFSFYNIINNNDIAGFYQQSGWDYSSAIFTMYNKNVDLNNFQINGKFGDSGSGTATLINSDKYSIHWVDITCPIKEVEGKYIFSQTKEGALQYDFYYWLQFISNCFIHFYRGTGWDNSDVNYFNRKMEFFLHFINNPDLYNVKLDEHVHYPKAHMDEWVWKHDYKLYKVI